LAIVHISLVTPLADGTTTPVAGVLRFTPTARRTITGTPDKVVLPASFQVALATGIADVTLATTTADWVWKVDEHLAGVPGRTIYAQVPNVAELDYSELVPIDPGTLAPSPTPQPAWISSLNLSLAGDPETLMVGAITRDVNDAPTSAPVVWPDGTAGTYTGTASATFPGAIDSYTLTYGTRTYTQPTVTRNANGGITTKPAITIS
jgi:hypothetical protein